MPDNFPALQILSIDAAVDPRNTGYAVATHDTGAWCIDALETGTRTGDLAERIANRLVPDRPILLAIDAPLGWPEPMTQALATHRAGTPLDLDPATGFSRQTDRVVRQKTGLKPLDVGADRIARTAAAALALIDEIRRRTGQPIPLLSKPQEARTGGLIEVYPAATLKQHGLPHRGYKRTDSGRERKKIAEGLPSELNLGTFRQACIDSDHCLDAVLCVLTAIDFLNGRCIQPFANPPLREGWIWFPDFRDD
jgi:hypothetical protein